MKPAPLSCSVIVPAYNAAGSIGACVASIRSQTVSDRVLEVIVVDDGSTDETVTIAERGQVKVLCQTQLGPAAARNRGAHAAAGEVLIFTDADCELDDVFVERILDRFEGDAEITGVQGSYDTRQRAFVARFAQVEIETRYARMEEHDTIDFIGSYAAAYRSATFHEAGGFDETFLQASGEDAELAYRLARQSATLVFERSAIVYHQHPDTLKKYLLSKFRRGRWATSLYRRHPAKAVSDSYTLQSVKAQIVLSALLPLCLVLALRSAVWLLPAAFIVGCFLVFSLPFATRYRQRGYGLKGLIPPVLLLRSGALALGLFTGLVLGLSPSPRKP